MEFDPGQVIDGKYRVVRRIGEGGMGTVYEGENSRIGRRVAIKILHSHVASMPDFVERFEREARAAARIGSPHVCDVLDLGDLPNGDRYIVMEYLDGVSFEDRLEEREKLSPMQLAPIAFELLEGLGTMHGARVVHRDLKPANVFLARTSGGRGETVKILDFGVAKLLPFAGEVGTMTQTGMMMGTPLYMSPEQARGARDVDGRTDIYAASVMFYRALAGVLPYNADTLNELLFKIVLEDPKPLREVIPEIDEVFAGIVHKGLARDIDQRFQSAREYQEAIAAWARAQGRMSMSFALTIASEPPPRTPITLPEAPLGAPMVANAVTGANAGTPIAWSEDAPRGGEQRDDSASASRSGSAGAPGTPPGSAAPPENGSKTIPLATTPLGSTGKGAQTLASPSDPSLPTANATTLPASVRDAVPAVAQETSARATPSESPARRRRGLLIGVAAGATAMGVVAVFALGRGAADSPPPAGISPVATASVSSAASVEGPAENASPLAHAEAASSAATGSDPSSTDAGTTPPPAATTTPPAHAPNARQENEGAPAKATETTAKSAATLAPSAKPAIVVAPAPAASATTPTPASSARKFRIKLD